MSPLTVGTHLYDADSDIRASLIKLILSTADIPSCHPDSNSKLLKEAYATAADKRGGKNKPFKIFIAYYSISLKT